MRSAICSSTISVLICAAALFSRAALAQSLSIVPKGDSNYEIEASAPSGNPHTLQASENLRLWVDLRNNIQGNNSFEFDSVGVSQRYFRLIPSPEPPAPIRVLIISDSMASDCCGWGGGMYDYFKPEATVVNYAMAWAGTKIFLQSAEKEKMLLIKPDYVLMQYGFIDGGTDPDRSTTHAEFEENLKTIVGMIREFNGVPILITLHAPRLWDENGKLIPGAWLDRNVITKKVAAELNTPLIDLYQTTFDIFTELGPTGTAFMEFIPGDFMHLSPLGAKYFSRLIAKDLPASLGPYLQGIFDPPPTP